MTSSHGRRIQGRRALAIMAWATLVVVAWLLWYGQHNHIIRAQAWEPAALLLSAYATFLAIFGWLLFSPGRKSAEESPALFFSGMLTLIPPCFIAYSLMPVGSPLKPWLTIGVFVFGIIAIMSPIPDEVFAVPRERRSYLQPLTTAYLSDLDVDAPQLNLDELAPRTAFWLSRPTPDAANSGPGVARDPWVDPFYGTGRQMSRIGVSKSRRTEETSPPERRKLSERTAGTETTPGLPTASGDVQPSFAHLAPPRSAARPASELPKTEADDSPRTGVPVLPTRSAVTGVADESRSIPLPPISRPESPSGTSLRTQGYSAGSLPGSQTPPPVPLPVPLSGNTRRPLTEPSSRANPAVGFQTPVAPVRPVPVPSLLSGIPPVVFPAASVPSVISEPPVAGVAPVEHRPMVSTFSSSASTPTPGSIPSVASDLPSMPPLPKVPLAPQLATSTPLPDLLGPMSRADRSSLLEREVAVPPTPVRKLSDPLPAVPMPTQPVSRSAELSVQELDRQLRAEETAAAKFDEEMQAANYEAESSAAQVPEVVRSGRQTSGDITLERIRDEHGGEMIEGTIKVFFEVGQKRAHLHIPFSPPLAGLPEVECEPTGDDHVRLKVAVRQPYGVRIEARRAEAGHALRTEISFAAVYTPSSPRG